MLSNKQVVLRDYANGPPKGSDMELMEVITNKSIGVNVPQGSNAVLVKNLYLSCDLYMGPLMRKFQGQGHNGFTSYTPGSVRIFVLVLSSFLFYRQTSFLLALKCIYF